MACKPFAAIVGKPYYACFTIATDHLESIPVKQVEVAWVIKTDSYYPLSLLLIVFVLVSGHVGENYATHAVESEDTVSLAMEVVGIEVPAVVGPAHTLGNHITIHPTVTGDREVPEVQGSSLRDGL